MKLPTKTFTILATSLLVAATALAGNYRVDTTHSEIAFKVSHLGISTVTGYFNDFSASFDLDPEDLSTLRVQATIQTKSVDTRVEDRDKHLKSADFFDVENHPEARFTSTAIAETAEGFEITGELELHGVTKQIKFPATIQVEGDRVTVQAEFFIQRFDFDIIYPGKVDDLIRDEVVIKIDLVAVPAG